MSNRLSKITTRTGDDGTTGLADGTRVPKHATRMQAIGTIDELNSFVGVFIAELPDENRLAADYLSIQHDLFDLGGELSMSSADTLVAVITKAHWQRLERLLEELNKDLEPLANFILPGGSRLLAACHVVRTVTRRAERCLSELGEAEQINGHSLKYLNRFSDLAFVSARWLAKELAIPEVLWRQT
ncbi:MAG: cob(I)yrinic acid a,c-diamide adenosyltransferase [Proteobacteria bacterium]|jgi:cob(I)alamin adenosyltransferase|nr:cob(I)yrinic acid a,c-diamide adenosyltransferase [Pseudomonadota bacterium]